MPSNALGVANFCSPIGGSNYIDRVLSTGPIAYWTMGEKSGGVSLDISGNARHGAYTAVILGQPGVGNGGTCPLFDGATSFNDVYSASLNGAFNGAEVSIMCWARVSAVGVWTDGADRQIFRFLVDGTNYIYLRKQVANNTINLARNGNGTLDQLSVAGLTTTDWMCWLVTVSEADDELIVYLGGAQQGLTQVGLGAWGGNLGAISVCVGASSTIPGEVWDGRLAHCPVWDRVISPAEAAELAIV